MKTEKLSEYLEKLSRNYYEKSGARDIYCYRDKLYKYCQITTDSLKLEFVYSFKGSENYPLSTLSCRVYLDGDSPYFFEIQELIDYLEIYDFHCYCFPYIESAARMKACFNYITDFIEYHLEEIASLKEKEDKLVKRKIDEIRAVYGFNEELIPSDNAGKESFFNNIFKHYSHFLVKRYSSEPAYLAFVNGEYAEAYEKYKKLEKKTAYEKKLESFVKEQYAPYQAVPRECASIIAVEKYKRTSFNTFVLLIAASVFMFCLLFVMMQLIANVIYTKTSQLTDLVSPVKAIPLGIIPGILTAVAFRKRLEPFFMKNKRSAIEFNSLMSFSQEPKAVKLAALISLLVCVIIFLGICKPSIIVYDTYLKYDDGDTLFSDYTIYELSEFSDVVIVEGYYADKNYTEYVKSPFYAFVTKGRGILTSKELNLSDEEIQKLINIIEPGMENYRKQSVPAIEDLMV